MTLRTVAARTWAAVVAALDFVTFDAVTGRRKDREFLARQYAADQAFVALLIAVTAAQARRRQDRDGAR